MNGLGQACVSVVRALGPPLFTPLFAWSVMDGRAFPFNFWLCWLLLGALAAATCAYARTLPGWLQRKRVREGAGG